MKTTKNYLHRICSLLLTLLFSATMVACSGGGGSIYDGLGAESDGVISSDIEDDGKGPEEDTTPELTDVLSKVETRLVKDLHNNETKNISFLVVNSETGNVVKSYQSLIPKRLASVSKLSTAVAALEEVRNVSVSKVSRMLQYSNNGEASRYVRLASKAIAGVTISTPGYSAAASCPIQSSQEKPAASVVNSWVKKEIPDVNWEGYNLNDGAGCDYGNFATALQTVWLLDYANSRGKVYSGKTFAQLLSISGQVGTWRHRNKDHKGRIFAKTGTLRPNSNLAGYFLAKRGGKFHKYYFAVFVEKRGGGNHTTKARKLIESLMRHWINQLAVKEGLSLGELDLS